MNKCSFWRLEPPIIDESGAITKGGMWPSHLKWWNLPNFIRVLLGGYGGGKTLQLCKRMISLCLENAPCPVAIVSPNYSMAMETVISTLEELLEHRARLDRHFKWSARRQSPFVFFVNYHGRKGRILVYSGEDPTKLKGPNLAAAGIDEPFIQEREVFDQMIARVRHPRAKHREINMSGTPESINNWGYDIVEGSMSKKLDIGMVRVSTEENKALPPLYIENLKKSLDERAAQAYIYGYFVNLSAGKIYYGFRPSFNVIDVPMFEGAELGAGMDFNVNPMAATIFWYSELSRYIHFIDEIELPNSDTEDMCALLRERYWDQGLRNVYPDATGSSRATAAVGRSDYYYIERAGFRIKAHRINPPRRDRYNAVNGMLCPPREAPVRCTISSKCEKLIKYLQSLTHESIHRPTQQAMTHLVDAFGYPIAYLFPVSRPTLRLATIRGF